MIERSNQGSDPAGTSIAFDFKSVYWLWGKMGKYLYSVVELKGPEFGALKQKTMASKIYTENIIVNETSKRGTGKNEFSPVRACVEFWTLDGRLLAFSDDCGNFSLENIFSVVDFLRKNPNVSNPELLKFINELNR